MNNNLLALCALLVVAVLGRKHFRNDNHYQVVGVECKENEAVSCLMIECPTGSFCPAENFCYNPKCVCRKGFRRVGGVCVPKHNPLHLNKATLESALLKIPYREILY
ncbi:uncharacterized protein LOC128257107 [Drosophila gunungcola]|uniref:Uncharacterized protein n=1 Tax=Drosophila gunungcola TaxID=103775 RepID=A0A9Q0BQV9_9MUSC|nr:uncharacterized protein LOC128257107 [Drosophila gunungcola]KAI8041272.1 hypothetical protein M5D96_005528 [Drosophila gunungcola]